MPKPFNDLQGLTSGPLATTSLSVPPGACLSLTLFQLHWPPYSSKVSGMASPQGFAVSAPSAWQSTRQKTVTPYTLAELRRMKARPAKAPPFCYLSLSTAYDHSKLPWTFLSILKYAYALLSSSPFSAPLCTPQLLFWLEIFSSL